MGPVLRVSIAHAREVLSDLTEEEADREFKFVLVTVRFSNHRVQFVPDGRPSATGRGSPGHTPSIHSWILLGSPDTGYDFAPANFSSQEVRNEAALARVAEEQSMGDVRSMWDTGDIAIHEMHKFLKRVNLPDNFNFSRAISKVKSADIREIYDWAHARLQT